MASCIPGGRTPLAAWEGRYQVTRLALSDGLKDERIFSKEKAPLSVTQSHFLRSVCIELNVDVLNVGAHDDRRAHSREIHNQSVFRRWPREARAFNSDDRREL